MLNRICSFVFAVCLTPFEATAAEIILTKTVQALDGQPYDFLSCEVPFAGCVGHGSPFSSAVLPSVEFKNYKIPQGATITDANLFYRVRSVGPREFFQGVVPTCSEPCDWGVEDLVVNRTPIWGGRSKVGAFDPVIDNWWGSIEEGIPAVRHENSAAFIAHVLSGAPIRADLELERFLLIETFGLFKNAGFYVGEKGIFKPVVEWTLIVGYAPGTSIPEPSTWSIAALGLIVLSRRNL